MTRFAILITTALTVLAGGCASAGSIPASSTPPEAAPGPEYAVVYIIREHAEPTAWPARVQLNGIPVASLTQKSCTRAYVAAGAYMVHVTWNRLSGQRRYASPFRVAAGRTYYLMVEGVSRLEATRYTYGAGLRSVDTDAGAKAVARCRTFTPPAQSSYPTAPIPAAES